MASSEVDLVALNETVRAESLEVQAALREVKKVIVGQGAVLDRMMVALLCRGHVLIEGVPGLAKTLAVHTPVRCSTCSSRASSSRRTCCRPTSPAR